MTGDQGGAVRGVWACYAAAVCAGVFAVPSFYWAFGGGLGRAAVGSWAVEASWGESPLLMVVVLVTAVLKVVGAGLALVLARWWRVPLPRVLVLGAGVGAAVVLLVYGAANLGAQVLVAVGVVGLPDDLGPVDRRAFGWHLYLWSPWFVVWGVLLGLASRFFWRVSR